MESLSNDDDSQLPSARFLAALFLFKSRKLAGRSWRPGREWLFAAHQADCANRRVKNERVPVELVDEDSYSSQTHLSMRGAASGRRGRTGSRTGGEISDQRLFTKLRQ